MLKKSFLLSQYENWSRHGADLDAQEKFLRGTERVENREWAAKSVAWQAHYAKLLRDGYGLHVGG
jgi:hypothetical protein